MSYEGHFYINTSKIIKHFYFIDLLLSEILFEKLLEQRDFYLNTLKHLSFELMMDPSKKELEHIEIMQTKTIEELKKVEQELAFLSSDKSH
jgi:hypothetical protein